MGLLSKMDFPLCAQGREFIGFGWKARWRNAGRIKIMPLDRPAPSGSRVKDAFFRGIAASFSCSRAAAETKIKERAGASNAGGVLRVSSAI